MKNAKLIVTMQATFLIGLLIFSGAIANVNQQGAIPSPDTMLKAQLGLMIDEDPAAYERLVGDEGKMTTLSNILKSLRDGTVDPALTEVGVVDGQKAYTTAVDGLNLVLLPTAQIAELKDVQGALGGQVGIIKTSSAGQYNYEQVLAYFQAESAEAIRDRASQYTAMAESYAHITAAELFNSDAGKALTVAQQNAAKEQFASIALKTAKHFTKDGYAVDMNNQQLVARAIIQHVGYVSGVVSREFGISEELVRNALNEYFNQNGNIGILRDRLSLTNEYLESNGWMFNGGLDDNGQWEFWGFGSTDVALNIIGAYAGEATLNFANAITDGDGEGLLIKLLSRSAEEIEGLLQGTGDSQETALAAFSARTAQLTWLVSKLGQGIVEAHNPKKAEASVKRWAPVNNLITTFDAMAKTEGWQQVAKDIDQIKSWHREHAKTSSSGLANTVEAIQTTNNLLTNYKASIAGFVQRLQAFVGQPVESREADATLQALTQEARTLATADMAALEKGVADSGEALEAPDVEARDKVANLANDLNDAMSTVPALVQQVATGLAEATAGTREEADLVILRTIPDVLVETGGAMDAQLATAGRVKAFSKTYNREVTGIDVINNQASINMRAVEISGLSVAKPEDTIKTTVAVAVTEEGAQAFEKKGYTNVVRLSELSAEGAYDLLSVAAFSKVRFLRANGVADPGRRLELIMRNAYRNLTGQEMPADYLAQAARVINVVLQPVTRAYEPGELEAYYMSRLLAALAA